MSSLSNYLFTNRKRLALSQEEVGFLIGINGESKGIKVSRDENSARVPDLRTALAYEAIYGKPIRELFAGLYEQTERDVTERAKLLRHREATKLKPKLQEVINNLVRLIK
jgi:transcriptional regulator with XRE-family HTH domain